MSEYLVGAQAQACSSSEMRFGVVGGTATRCRPRVKLHARRGLARCTDESRKFKIYCLAATLGKQGLLSSRYHLQFHLKIPINRPNLDGAIYPSFTDLK
jgi:hypothetical protein